jgi:hypothetical protein
MLLTLSTQEKGHKERLEEMDIDKVRNSILPGALEALPMHDDLMLTPINEFKELKEIFDFAIKAEQGAHDMYVSLGNAVSEQNAKHVFENLADEETKHKELLMAEKEKLGI